MPSSKGTSASSQAGDDESLPAPGSPLRHYPSTPHLQTFRVVGRSVSSAKKNPPKPVLSTFSSFSQQHKSGTDLRYRDDPNPYSVSNIQEFRIQVQDPYKTRSTTQLNRPSPASSSRGSGTYYQVEDEVFDDEDAASRSSAPKSGKFYPRSNSSNNSAGYEVPDPDYGGSSGGSSEDLPLPPALPPASDSSEEYSHSLSMSASSASGGPSPSPVQEDPPSASPTKISPADGTKIEFALRGRKTEIFVADSLANLYTRGKTGPEVEWIYVQTGVPVLLLDTGETKSRDKRRIQIVLAELGSGLALWKDIVDNLTSYQVVGEAGSTFHTMHLSSDHTKVLGLSFDNDESADRFARQVDRLTSDFANISLSGSKYKGKREKGRVTPKPKWVKPKKSDISQPCCFQHVSTMSPKDKTFFSSLQNFVRPANKNITTTTEVSL